MNQKPLGTIFLILCLISAMLVQPIVPARGQESPPGVLIEALDAREFPKLTMNFSIPGGLGQETSLAASQVSVIENDTQIAVDSLASEYVGVHYGLVINPERTLVLTYASGFSNYDRMLAAMRELGSDLTPVTGDVYSLFINPNIRYDQLENYTEWKKALEDYTENQRQMNSSLQSIEEAISLLTSNPLAKETVLVYMTPYIEPTEVPALTALIKQAGEAGIPVHIWMTAAPVVIGSAYQTDLDTACQTWGGSLTILSGSQIPPNPRDYLKGKGYRYTVTWQSEVRSGSTQKIGLRLTPPGGGVLTSAVSDVALEVLPTSLSFSNLPEQLTVTIRGDELIEPAELPIQAAIEFPDGFPREVLSTSLFANGSLVQQHNEAPFGDFVLDLTPLRDQTKLSLQLTLEDALGFETRSEMKYIELIWFDPNADQPKPLQSNSWLWIGIGLAALGLLGVIILPTRLKKKPVKSDDVEPAAPAVRVESESYVLVKTYGSLIKLDRDNTPCAEKPLLLIKEVTLIGKDPQLANLVLNDEALEPLHAEIHAFPDGRTRLTDFHTIAGTYVNFQAVDTKGAEIHHGDILHFGRLSYRFNSPNRVTSSKI
ncbi:MAG TPA: FHA domain-containing protein [Anaerolineaceae bacterium]|nr:FHA domain-containing protein [Anaerolineaceae bacterium]